MEISPGIGLLAVVLLVLANGFFVATEFALVAVRRTRLEQLAAEGSRTAKAAQGLVTHLDSYIAACQFGITIASLGLGWVGEPALAGIIEGPLTRVLGSYASAVAHTLTVGVAFAVITALHIVVGELAPKGVALQRPEATTLFVTHPIRIFYKVFRWPIGILNWVGNAVLRALGFRESTGHEMVHTSEELRLLVTESHQAGEVEESEARIARRAFQFAELTAGELMTPRTEIGALPVGLPLPELVQRAYAAGHSRLPVYEESLDQVVGILKVRELLGAVQGGTPPDLKALLQPAHVVPLTRRADDLLEDMRNGAYRVAVVVDEYGGTAGIITLHDLMEGLVGRFDESGEPPSISAVLADGSRVFDGLVRLGEFEEATGLRIPEDDREQADTLSGLLMLRLGRIPAVGDVVKIEGGRLTVEAVAHQRADRVRLRTLRTDDPEPAPATP